MSLYETVADLPLTVESIGTEARERATSSGFTRRTTTVALHGPDATGRGEDGFFSVTCRENVSSCSSY